MPGIIAPLDALECLEEIHKESRKFTGDYTSTSQEMVYTIVIGEEFYPAFGDEDQSTLAIQIGWLILPNFRILPGQQDVPVLLMLNQMQMEQIGRRSYKITGSYAYNANTGFSGQAGSDDEESEILPQIRINFTVGGDTKHITKSITTMGSARSTPEAGFETPPDLQGAIGATKDSIAGADIPDDNLRLQVTVYYKPQFVNFALMTKFKKLVGRLNGETFMGQPKRSVMFLGASGGGTVLDIIPITFDLDLKDYPSRDDEGFPDLPDGTSPFDIIDYLWKSTFKVGDGDFVIAEPIYRYVHIVHESASFSVLGFGQ